MPRLAPVASATVPSIFIVPPDPKWMIIVILTSFGCRLSSRSWCAHHQAEKQATHRADRGGSRPPDPRARLPPARGSPRSWGPPGLTHGGSYKHFDSRDELIAAAAERAMSASGPFIARVPGRRGPAGGVRRLVRLERPSRRPRRRVRGRRPRWRRRARPSCARRLPGPGRALPRNAQGDGRRRGPNSSAAGRGDPKHDGRGSRACPRARRHSRLGRAAGGRSRRGARTAALPAD